MIAAIEIDVLRDDEIEAAVALWRDAGLTRPWNDPRADAHRALAGPSSTILAVRLAGAVVGTAMVGDDGHRGWVYYVGVRADARGRGLGKMLMRAAERWLADRGVPKLNLLVRDDNTAVRDFYRRIGYETSDVVVLSRDLSGAAGSSGPHDP